jgi:hypothetical protein
VFDDGRQPVHLVCDQRRRITALCASDNSDEHKVQALPLLGFIQPERHPQLSAFREIESARHDPDHERRLPIQPNGRSDHTRIAAKPAPPQRVAEHDGQIGVRDIFIDAKHATTKGRDSEQREERRRDVRGGQLLRPVRSSPVDTRCVERRHLTERLRVFPHREVVRGEGHFLLEVEQQFVDPIELTRLWKRQRPEQDRLHDAEHGRGAGDAQRDRERGQDRPRWSPGQQADRVTDVLPYVVPAEHGKES